MSRERTPEQSNIAERWWIFGPDGRRDDLGPFVSVDQAITIRTYVENVERREDLSVQQEGNRS